MNEYLKEIHIGTFIKQAVYEKNIDAVRICNFLDCSPDELAEMYESDEISTKKLLRWSKLLEYDFFRLYTYHLLLYTPKMTVAKRGQKTRSQLPQLRKNYYSIEIINFMVEMIEKKEMTIPEILERYNIAKTTLYRWINKSNKPT